MKYCEECGAAMEDDEIYCSECGAKAEPLLDEQSETTQTEDTKPINNKDNYTVEHKNGKLYIVIGVMLTVIVAVGLALIIFFVGKNDENDTLDMDTSENYTVDMETEIENASDEIVTEESTTEESTTEEPTTEEPTTEEPTTEEPTIDKSISNAYVGTWWDLNSQRCHMDIECEDGVNYSINIGWASSASENTEWLFTGKYDSDKNGIVYVGKCVNVLYPDEGDVVTTYIYTNGEGLLYIGEDGLLYWDDYIENIGARCMFEKSNY